MAFICLKNIPKNKIKAYNYTRGGRMKKIFLLLLILSLLVGCSSAKNDFMRVYSKENKKLVDNITGFTISDTFNEITVDKGNGSTWLTYLVKKMKKNF